MDRKKDYPFLLFLFFSHLSVFSLSSICLLCLLASFLLFSVWLPIYFILSAYLFVNMSICQFLHFSYSAYLSLFLSGLLSPIRLCLSVFLSWSVCLTVCLTRSICTPQSVLVCLSVRFRNLSVDISACMPVFLFTFFSLITISIFLPSFCFSSFVR